MILNKMLGAFAEVYDLVQNRSVIVNKVHVTFLILFLINYVYLLMCRDLLIFQ